MTDLSTLAASLSEALASYDAVVRACPANKTFLGEKPCPKCGAMSNEGCREENRAAYGYIQETRTALRDHLERNG